MPTTLFEPGDPDTLYLVDLSSYMLRAYHAIRELSSPSGEPTHAVYGTVTMLERLVRERKPKLFAVAMDSGRVTFRRELYADYKANRPPAPDDLRSQIKRCEEIVRAFAVPVFKSDGVEADDLIACVAQWTEKHGLNLVIVGADKDLMQLVSDKVVLWDTMRERVFGVEEVEERFGVRVDQLRDLFALVGDTSDNIPGVPSVGPKTARDLLVEYGSLEGVYEHLDDIKRKSLKETLSQNRDKAFLSRQLVTLKTDCAIEFDLDKLSYGGRDIEALRRIYTELGFQRQLSQLDQSPASAKASRSPEKPRAERSVTAPPAPKVEIVLDLAALHQVSQRCRDAKRISLEVLTTSPERHRGPLVGVAVACEPGLVYYVPLSHRYLGAPTQLGLSAIASELGPIFASPDIRKHAFDLKRTAARLAQHGMSLGGLFGDCKLCSYLVDPEAESSLEALAKRELSLELPAYDTISKKGRGQRLDFDEQPLQTAADFVAPRIDAILRLSELLLERVSDEGLGEVYRNVELPLSALLAKLEGHGVLVDVEHLRQLGTHCTSEIHRLEKDAHRIAGKPFNVNSPRQLETLLFDELGLKPIKRTKTSRSTDAATLEALADQHELPRVILEIRQLSKLKGTYIEALPNLVDQDTGRIHCSWEQTVAATGRISSTEPNLQNIPIRSELGSKIREAFIAPPGYQLVSGDYSQIELRVLAHLSKDPVLLDAFRTGQDIHTRTAMEIFEVPVDQVTREMRTRSKAVNFGVIYGQGDSGLAKVLGIPRVEAGNFIAAYFRRYEGVRRFMDETLQRAREGEVVHSLLGRRRMLPDIRSGNRARRLAAERIAMNMPIQGTAADLLKLAMLALEGPVTPGSRMILTVHDELVFEVPEAEVAEAESQIRTKMENVYPLDVPLVVEVRHGKNWQQAH